MLSLIGKRMPAIPWYAQALSLSFRALTQARPAPTPTSKEGPFAPRPKSRRPLTMADTTLVRLPILNVLALPVGKTNVVPPVGVVVPAGTNAVVTPAPKVVF